MTLLMENKRRICFIFLGVASVLITVSSYMAYMELKPVLFIPPRQRASKLPDHINMKDIARQSTGVKVATLAKIINNANKHVRGSKTSGYLKDALSVMKHVLKDLNIDEKGLFERPSVKSENVCPESYMGGAFGFPLYYKGFEVDQCNYGSPIASLVTVIKYFDLKQDNLESKNDPVERFVASASKAINGVKVLIALNNGPVNNGLKKKYTHVNIMQSSYTNEGFALNSLVHQVKTPYVLIAKGVEFFTNDSRLERMVRELESLYVVAVGGAFRYPNGHWHKGCFQSVYRNYTLKYISGYDESFHECLFCDYIQGPFVTSTSYLKTNVFGDFNENDGLYEDWYLGMYQRGDEAVLCPDSMFHLKDKVDDSLFLYKEFMQRWDLLKMITPSGRTVTRGCEHQDTQSRKSFALSPCGLKLNTGAVKFIMKACEEVDLICELQEGTAMGALKFGSSLPWELDYDIRFSLTNCSKCHQMEKLYERSGVKFEPFAYECCMEEPPKLGYRNNFKVTVNGYKGDFTAHPVLDSEELVKAGIQPTKVLFDGQWVNFGRNPGHYMRNRYGKEIFRHAEHWIYSAGKNAHGKSNYTTNIFQPCKTPGVHNCLDRYNADGNLPFFILLP
ncbi:uncharacterized protein LOC132740973 [Ruditapes philippinarum]|uniref:uncharacterized protein LOC132740973 n=1 Tax=Ruditapes philippinarum TaxID=129788 RepID=UPI00295A8EA9|nr:uncharacterized protein LOC132740973 [Ruditapes philippinarum]XP_060585021.1 uncharacterized protein LOC132740973 [Ruditapes philippinarum]